MARASTTSDAFNAIAEPQRRQILELLKQRELPVHELAERLGIAQPSTSKYPRVLREVQLVRVRDVGKQRYYGLDAYRLQPIHQWVGDSRSSGTGSSTGSTLRNEIKHEGDQ